MANYNGSLEAVDCHMYSQREMIWCECEPDVSQMSHQVTYDVVATPIRPKRASAVQTMLLYYHGQL
eukprot:scaffold10854_cov155-Skeletonema_dohrnii-CCMP3373.AAC.23